MGKVLEWVKVAPFAGGKGLTLVEALAELAKRKLRLPSSLELDARLVASAQWEEEREMYPCWAGPFAVYLKPGEVFGETVKWRGLTVKVPKEFQGKSGFALVGKPEDVQLDEKTKTFSSSKLNRFNLPLEDGWYDIEPVFGLPIGEEKGYAASRRHLWRWQDEAFIGLAVRGDGDFVVYRRGVFLYDLPDGRFGVWGVREVEEKKKRD
ncbi:MAG: hypothetical protein M0R66_01375 [Candidatus Omnitrophica bacterium]|nr:hypothetical protein [Candidatus Omnitrophota bacterium]